MRDSHAIAALLGLQLLAIAGLAWWTGITTDEPSHLVSAHLYWLGQDTLQPRDMPPLIKIAGGWATLPFHLQMPVDHPAWKSQHEWVISQALLERLPHERIGPLFFAARLALAVFPLATTFLIWWWARALLAPRAALFAAAVFAFEPTSLAHAALFKNDHAATFTFLLLCWSAWRYAAKPGAARALLLATATAAACLAKLSLFVFAPAAILAPLLRRRFLHVPLVMATAYGIAVAACQFDATRLIPAEIDNLARDAKIPALFTRVAWLGTWIPVPRLLWDGLLAILRSNGDPNLIWFWGAAREGGHPAYFLGALLVKLPEALLLLSAAGVWLTLRARRWWWVLPPVLFIALASTSTLQLGVRLILPAFPFFALWAAHACETPRRWARALFALFLVTCAAALPYGISYFNWTSGGRGAALRYLADSNVDWGQDLRALARYPRGGEKVHLFYFGNDNMWRFLTDQDITPHAPPWSDAHAEGEVYRPPPGLYAVSANLLTGIHFAPKYRNYFAEFRRRQRVGIAGGSIYLYRIAPPPLASQPAEDERKR